MPLGLAVGCGIRTRTEVPALRDDGFSPGLWVYADYGAGAEFGDVEVTVFTEHDVTST